MTFQYVASDGLATSAPATVTIAIVQPIRTPEQILAQLEFEIDEFIGVGELDADAGAALLAETGEIADALAAGEPTAALDQSVEVAGKKIDELVKDELLTLAAANQLYRFAHDLLRSMGAFMPPSLLELRIAINNLVASGQLAQELSKGLRNAVASVIRGLVMGHDQSVVQKLDQFQRDLLRGLRKSKILDGGFEELAQLLDELRIDVRRDRCHVASVQRTAPLIGTVFLRVPRIPDPSHVDPIHPGEPTQEELGGFVAPASTDETVFAFDQGLMYTEKTERGAMYSAVGLRAAFVGTMDSNLVFGNPPPDGVDPMNSNTSARLRLRDDAQAELCKHWVRFCGSIPLFISGRFVVSEAGPSLGDGATIRSVVAVGTLRYAARDEPPYVTSGDTGLAVRIRKFEDPAAGGDILQAQVWRTGGMIRELDIAADGRFSPQPSVHDFDENTRYIQEACVQYTGFTSNQVTLQLDINRPFVDLVGAANAGDVVLAKTSITFPDSAFTYGLKDIVSPGADEVVRAEARFEVPVDTEFPKDADSASFATTCPPPLDAVGDDASRFLISGTDD